jgi:hypothetical protein
MFATSWDSNVSDRTLDRSRHMAKASERQKKAKPKPKLTDKEQSERFKQTARELGISEEGGSSFEQTFSKIARKRTGSSRNP